jgi:hypothetical protein
VKNFLKQNSVQDFPFCLRRAKLQPQLIDTFLNHMLGEGYMIHCVWSRVSAAIKQRCAFKSNVKTVCCVTVLLQESSTHTTECCRKRHIATETTVMEESNGIHGKPVSPIVFFFNEFLKVGSTSTPAGQVACEAAEY